jgi:hypothetical protein
VREVPPPQWSGVLLSPAGCLGLFWLFPKVKMKAIILNGVMSGVSTRTDGSLGIRIESGELIPEEKLMVFNLQNIPCEISFTPRDADAEPPKIIKGEFDRKSQSQRVHSALYVWWRQLGEPGLFDAFYQSETEKFITSIKNRLKPI